MGGGSGSKTDAENDYIAAYKRLSAAQKKLIPKSNAEVVFKKNKRWAVRCQAVTDGKQCERPREDKKWGLKCGYHAKVGVVKDRMAKMPKHYLPVATRGFLQGELDKLKDVPLRDLEGFDEDIRTATAAINILKASPEDDPKKKEYKAKGLIYTLKVLAEIKGAHNDVKFSDTNTISREVFNYVYNRINQIIIDEVRDPEIMRRIAERVTSLGLEIKTGQFKLR